MDAAQIFAVDHLSWAASGVDTTGWTKSHHEMVRIIESNVDTLTLQELSQRLVVTHQKKIDEKLSLEDNKKLVKEIDQQDGTKLNASYHSMLRASSKVTSPDIMFESEIAAFFEGRQIPASSLEEKRGFVKHAKYPTILNTQDALRRPSAVSAPGIKHHITSVEREYSIAAPKQLNLSLPLPQAKTMLPTPKLNVLPTPQPPAPGQESCGCDAPSPAVSTGPKHLPKQSVPFDLKGVQERRTVVPPFMTPQIAQSGVQLPRNATLVPSVPQTVHLSQTSTRSLATPSASPLTPSASLRSVTAASIGLDVVKLEASAGRASAGSNAYSADELKGFIKKIKEAGVRVPTGAKKNDMIQNIKNALNLGR